MVTYKTFQYIKPKCALHFSPVLAWCQVTCGVCVVLNALHSLCVCPQVGSAEKNTLCRLQTLFNSSQGIQMH